MMIAAHGTIAIESFRVVNLAAGFSLVFFLVRSKAHVRAQAFKIWPPASLCEVPVSNLCAP